MRTTEVLFCGPNNQKTITVQLVETVPQKGYARGSKSQRLGDPRKRLSRVQCIHSWPNQLMAMREGDKVIVHANDEE